MKPEETKHKITDISLELNNQSDRKDVEIILSVYRDDGEKIEHKYSIDKDGVIIGQRGERYAKVVVDIDLAKHANTPGEFI